MMDYAALKHLTRAQLEAMVPTGFRFKCRPWDHQLASWLATVSEPGFNIWLDLGTGKTKVAIDAVRFLSWGAARRMKTLVVCLNSAVYNWVDEVEMNSDDPVIAIRPENGPPWKLLQRPGWAVVNYEALRNLLSHKVAAKTEYDIEFDVERVTKRKQRVDPSAMKQFLRLGFEVLIIDESHVCKSTTTLNFKVLSRIGKDVPNRLLLTGTPYGKTLLDIWSQYFIVDRGATYGPMFGSFREANFEDKGYFGPDWKVTPAGRKRIEAKLFTRAIRYSEAEIKDMPPKVYRVLKFNLTAEQQRLYAAATDKSLIEAGAAVNRTMLHRQICSGIVVKTNTVLKDSPKIKLLQDLLESVVNEHKVVIFHEFILEGQQIEQLLRKLKIKYCALNGAVKDKHGSYKRFELDPVYRVMVAHPKSGGASINLNVARYCVFYSNGHSPIDRAQCEKRIHRGEIKNSCFYYDLMANNTIEVAIHRALKSDMDLFARNMNSKQLRQVLDGVFDPH